MSLRLDICITHAAASTALGHDLESTWQALCRGESGIAPVSRFDVSGFTSGLAACVPELPMPEKGRSQLFSLLEPLWPQLSCWPLEKAGCMLFTASTKAGVDVLERRNRGESVVMGDALPQNLRREVCRRLGLPVLSGEHVSAACASGAIAIIRAAQHLLDGRCTSALVLAADIVSSFTMSGFSSLRALSATPCRPFDVQRDGLTVGEGAAALLLLPVSKALSLECEPLGLLTGWGQAADARHITAPARDGRGLVKATQQALCRAGRKSVDAVCAHGTGTVYNDAMELTAFEQVFSDLPPVFSVKGALGHSMGACAAMEIALCMQAMRHKRLPPTCGCSQPEPALTGCVQPRSQEFPARTMLSCNSGFGGVNAALVLENPHEREEPWAFL